MTQDVPYDLAEIRQYTLSLLKETCPDMDPKQMSLTADRLLGSATEEFEKRLKIRERKAKARNIDPRLVVSKEAYEALCKESLPSKRARNVFNTVDSNVEPQSNLDDVDIHNKTAHPRFSPTYNESKRAALPYYSPDESSREASNLSAPSEFHSRRLSPTTLDSENTEGGYSEKSLDGFPPHWAKANGFNGRFYNRGYSSGEGKDYPPNGINDYPAKGPFRGYRRDGRNGVRFGKRGRPNHFNKNIHQNVPTSDNGFQKNPYQANAPIPKRKRFT